MYGKEICRALSFVEQIATSLVITTSKGDVLPPVPRQESR